MTVVTVVATVLGLIIPALTQGIVLPAMTQGIVSPAITRGTVMPLTMAQAVMALAAILTKVQVLIMAIPANIPNMTEKTLSRSTRKSPGRIQTMMAF